MQPITPYRPRPRRDPQVLQLFWQGVYYALAVGLLAGIGLWAFLLLGGAPFAAGRQQAVLTLAASGLLGALTACAWVWGYRGLRLVGPDVITAVGYRLEWLVWPFIWDRDEDRRLERAEAAAWSLANVLLAVPSGIAVMVALAGAGIVRPLNTAALGLLAFLGAAVWLLAVAGVWQWAVLRGTPPPPAPQVSAAAERVRESRLEAELDSSLQLAVARSKRAKADGDLVLATEILEQAMRDARAAGRSVAHMQLHYHLAWLYASRGNPDGAAVMFRTVLELADPDSEEYREALGALERMGGRADVGAPPHEPVSRILEQDTLDYTPD